MKYLRYVLGTRKNINDIYGAELYIKSDMLFPDCYYLASYQPDYTYADVDISRQLKRKEVIIFESPASPPRRITGYLASEGDIYEISDTNELISKNEISDWVGHIAAEAFAISIYNMYCSIDELYSYNKSDSPCFSQIGSLRQAILTIMDNRYLPSIRYLGELSKHPTQWLMNSEGKEIEWDGAPVETIKKARESLRKFKKMVGAIYPLVKDNI